MPLTIDQFNHLASTCAPGIDPRTLRPFAQVESSYDPLAIHDNTSGLNPHADTEAQAIAIARDLIARGHVVDSGIMQISNRNFEWLGLTVETAFNPCQSIRAAAQHLTEASIYNTGSRTRGFENGYVGKIVNATFNLQPSHAEPVRSTAPVATGPPEPTGPVKPWDVFERADPNTFVYHRKK
jgi:type IV secretion system protein VirB1